MFNFHEKKSFKEVIESLNPKAESPSYTTIKNNIEDMKESFYKFVQSEMLNEPFCSMTTDLWTSLIYEHYIDLTISFIDKNFEIKNYVLAVKELEESVASAENLLEEFKNILGNFKFEKKELIFTCDRGKNIVKSIKLAQNQPLKRNLINCFCHLLDNVIVSSLDEFKLLKKVKFIISAFRKSKVK
jgi:hypothetical protein